MKVYLVWGDPHQWEEEVWLADVCLTREIAEKAKREFEKEYPTEEFSIEEYDVREN